MKKACTFLLLAVFCIYLYKGYDLYRKHILTEKTNGFISDIAEEVVAIPLETNGKAHLTRLDLVKKDGNHLFLVSNRQLYHFDCSGRFIGQITNQRGEDMQVSDYVVDPTHKRLIVVGNRQDIYYYGYGGNLLEKKECGNQPLWNRLYSLSYYDQMVWAVVDKYVRDATDPSVCRVEKFLCQYTTDFLELQSLKLLPAGLGRDYSGYFDPEICVGEDGLYAYTPSMEPDKILKDTLYILQRQGLFPASEALASIYPVRMGERFFLSSYSNCGKDPSTFTFCYDKAENTAYLVSGGFQDDFYQTGRIAKLHSVDVHTRTLCYIKSGAELKKAFPHWKEGDNPVVFLVQLKA